MSESAFKFLLQEGTQPFRSSTCYIVADPKVMNRRLWKLELEHPVDAEWVLRIDDMKDWMLHGNDSVRKMYYDIGDPRTPFRELERDVVFREYVRKFLDELPAEQRRRRKHVLMPSIGDERTRVRYRSAIEAALPGVTIIPEPEMVAEYFRLIERTLALEDGANNVILVIDVGAATADMTLVVSRRDQTIVDVDARGDQRDQRIRALRGDSVARAGRWIDEQIASALGARGSTSDRGREDHDRLIRAIEKAKVGASRSRADTPLDGALDVTSTVVTVDLLRTVSRRLVDELNPLFQKLCERLYGNNTRTEDARRKSEERFTQRRVSDGGDAHRLIDFILLAGGSSLLPGFDEAILETFFPDGRRPALLHVGTSFAIAAAAGGLAHRLHNYAPPRLREFDENGSVVARPALESTLPYPLLMGIKQTSGVEELVTILDPNEQFIDDGGTRPIENLPPLAAGSRPRIRLVPGGSAGVEARKGRRFKAFEVRMSPGRMELEWDPIRQRATVHSNQVHDTKSTLWIDAEPLRRREEAALDPFDDELEPGMLAVDEAEDVVIDLGMSKVVALTAERGTVSAEGLQRVVAEGLDTSEIIPRHENPGDPIVGVGSEGSSHSPPVSLEVLSKPLPATSTSLRIERENELRLPDEVGVVSKQPPRDNEGQRSTNDRTGALPNSSGIRRTDWGSPISDAQFSFALEELRDDWTTSPKRFDDVVVTLLAMAVRPIVLLAGPPGCGKSTLARTIAKILGMEAGRTFHEVPVQAHWENDHPLFSARGSLRHLLDDPEGSHLLLFDEFNLTRPEYYLARLFHVLDGGIASGPDALQIARCRVIGTLNIDDSSRPPSPKVIDRSFLLELEQARWDAGGFDGPPDPTSLRTLPGLPFAAVGDAISDRRIDDVMKVLHDCVLEHDLRHDLLPSRRALSDVKALLGLHHRLDLEGRGLLDRDDLVDRILASRILVKLSGAFDQVQPALDAVENVVEGMEELGRTRRRVKLARQQSRLGFVSPWQ